MRRRRRRHGRAVWTWHNFADGPILSVEWGYSDNTTGSTFYNTDALNGWTQQNVLPNLVPAKQLVYLRVWGYSGGQNLPDITRFDDLRICRVP